MTRHNRENASLFLFPFLFRCCFVFGCHLFIHTSISLQLFSFNMYVLTRLDSVNWLLSVVDWVGRRRRRRLLLLLQYISFNLFLSQNCKYFSHQINTWVFVRKKFHFKFKRTHFHFDSRKAFGGFSVALLSLSLWVFIDLCLYYVRKRAKLSAQFCSIYTITVTATSVVVNA